MSMMHRMRLPGGRGTWRIRPSIGGPQSMVATMLKMVIVATKSSDMALARPPVPRAPPGRIAVAGMIAVTGQTHTQPPRACTPTS